MSGEIESGRNFSQSEICEILGQSISPVREALKLLQHEGFVDVLPRSGIHVMKPDLALFRDCHQFRVILELAAIGPYVDTVSEAELRDLEALQLDHQAKTREKVALSELRPTQMELERRLHFGIIDALRNTTIAESHKICMEKLNLIRIDQGGFTNAQMERTANEHLTIIRAALAQDAQAARLALDTHLQGALHRAMGAVA